MTSTYDPELCTRLAAEAREDDERMTPGPLLIGSDAVYLQDGRTVVIEICTEDRCGYDATGFARQRNNLRSVADQLDAAQARIAIMEAVASDVAIDHDHAARSSEHWMKVSAEREARIAELERERDSARAERDRNLEMARVAADARDTARARILQLEEAGRSANENWMAACKERDAARAEVDQLRRVIAGVKRTIAEPCATCGAPAGELCSGPTECRVPMSERSGER